MAKKNDNDEDHELLSDVLKQFVKQNHLQHGLDKVEVEKAWYSEMGPAVKNYTSAIQFKNETLYVQLSSSVLREELSYGKAKIVGNLNEALGKKIIAKLVLR